MAKTEDGILRGGAPPHAGRGRGRAGHRPAVPEVRPGPRHTMRSGAAGQPTAPASSRYSCHGLPAYPIASAVVCIACGGLRRVAASARSPVASGQGGIARPRAAPMLMPMMLRTMMLVMLRTVVLSRTAAASSRWRRCRPSCTISATTRATSAPPTAQRGLERLGFSPERGPARLPPGLSCSTLYSGRLV